MRELKMVLNKKLWVYYILFVFIWNAYLQSYLAYSINSIDFWILNITPMLLASMCKTYYEDKVKLEQKLKEGISD